MKGVRDHYGNICYPYMRWPRVYHLVYARSERIEWVDGMLPARYKWARNREKETQYHWCWVVEATVEDLLGAL